MNLLKNTKLITIATFAYITFLFIYKLDYAYFFTDEILYIDSGREHIKNIFTSTMQVPPLTKYLAVLMYKIADHAVFLLRLPFATMGIISSFFTYLIIKRSKSVTWGLIGALLYSSFTILYNSTRMVMLEPLMHLSWLGFMYFFVNYIETKNQKHLIASGIFLGLAFMSKITSVVLIPLLLVGLFIYKEHISIKKVSIVFLVTSSIVVLLSYLHPIITFGEINTVRTVITSIYEVYFTKSVEGKLHVINNKVYEYSPWWAYFYYFYISEGILKILLVVLGFVGLLKFKNKESALWLVLLALVVGFHQFSGIKNERYVSSMQVPLVIISVYGISTLYEYSKQYIKATLVILLSVIFVSHLFFVLNQKPTEYNALFQYLGDKTNNFTDYKNIYIYGSTRSARWYKHERGDGFIRYEISKNLDAHCPGFWEYDFVVIEKEELKRYGENLLYAYAEANLDVYNKDEMFGFLVYEKTNYDIQPVLDCN